MPAHELVHILNQRETGRRELAETLDYLREAARHTAPSILMRWASQLLAAPTRQLPSARRRTWPPQLCTISVKVARSGLVFSPT